MHRLLTDQVHPQTDECTNCIVSPLSMMDTSRASLMKAVVVVQTVLLSVSTVINIGKIMTFIGHTEI